MLSEVNKKEERKDYFVYLLLRPDTKIPFYVGKGSGRRISSHFTDERGNSHKANIIRQAKAEGKEILGIKLATGLTEKQAFALEVEWIAKIGREPSGPLVNKTPGGEGVSGPKNRTPEHTAKLLAIHTGREFSPETRAKLSAALKGRKHTPEHRAKHAAALRGRKLSDEVRANMSAAQKGKKCAEGTRLAVIESNKKRAGFKWSPEYREMMMAARAEKKAARQISKQDSQLPLAISAE
jgi:hypothetical protein